MKYLMLCLFLVGCGNADPKIYSCSLGPFITIEFKSSSLKRVQTDAEAIAEQLKQVGLEIDKVECRLK